MSLDLGKVVVQVGGMVARLKASIAEKHQHLQEALEIVASQAIDLAELKRKIDISQGRITWLVADLVDGLGQGYEAPPPPPEFSVVATDGSHIDVDRHKSTRCYLINIGAAMLHYGIAPGALLDSFPCLYAEDKDLVIVPAKGREQPIEGTLLGIKRAVEECRYLAELAAGLPAEGPVLALVDGSLILWGLEAYPEFVTGAMLGEGFLRHLEALKKLGQQRLALASYISFPRSTDVVNVLRLALCPYQPPDCDLNCPLGKAKECDKVAGVQDRELFFNLLREGQRSPVFISRSSVVRKHYGEHQVHFCYLRLEDEVARIEMPRWVATDEALLNLVHSLVRDQCQRGLGYPVALSEAHEQAVISTADKENFWQLVESSLLAERLPTLTSAKSQSKRTRWV